MELAGGKDRGGRLPGTPLNVPSVRSGFKTWEYSVSSGALLDLSLRGAIRCSLQGWNALCMSKLSTHHERQHARTIACKHQC